MAIAKDLEMRPLLARCHLGLGTMHLRTDDPVNARNHLTTARDMFGAMEMRYWLEKAAAEMPDLW